MRYIAKVAGFLIEHTAYSYKAALEQRNAVVRSFCRPSDYDACDVAAEAARPPSRLVVVGVRKERIRRFCYELTTS